jgi:hypothetical protein
MAMDCTLAEPLYIHKQEKMILLSRKMLMEKADMHSKKAPPRTAKHAAPIKQQCSTLRENRAGLPPQAVKPHCRATADLLNSSARGQGCRICLPAKPWRGMALTTQMTRLLAKWRPVIRKPPP